MKLKIWYDFRWNGHCCWLGTSKWRRSTSKHTSICEYFLGALNGQPHYNIFLLSFCLYFQLSNNMYCQIELGDVFNFVAFFEYMNFTWICQCRMKIELNSRLDSLNNILNNENQLGMLFTHLTPHLDKLIRQIV